jgi:effector-binding domain-containing protein
MEINETEVTSQQALAIRDHSTAAGLSEKYHELYDEIDGVCKKQSLNISGTPFGIYHKFTLEDVDVEAGFPVSGTPKDEGRVKVINTYGGKTVHTRYVGPYEGLGDAWAEFMKLAGEKNYKITGSPFEVYTTDPASEPDSSKWITDIYAPIE